MKIKNTSNSEHYLWGESCDGWHLLKSDSLSIIQEKMPPNTEEGLHFHSKAQQFFLYSREQPLSRSIMKFTPLKKGTDFMFRQMKYTGFLTKRPWI